MADSEIRSLTVSASRYKDPEQARWAALKAWKTIRAKKRKALAKGTSSLLEFKDEKMFLPLLSLREPAR